MPVYNCSEFIEEAIQSILTQTFSNFELIIVDDNSTDQTREIISRCFDQRIIFIAKPIRTGIANSLNIALSVARGDFIARMDGDDISFPARLESQVEFMKANPKLIVCGTSYEILNTGKAVHPPSENDDVRISFLSGCHIAHPTVMMKRSILQENNLQYDPNCEPAEDYDLWVRLLSYGTIVNIPDVLLKYRIHDKQTSVAMEHLQIDQANKARLKLLKSFLPEELLTPNNVNIHLALMKNDFAATFPPDQVENWLNELIYNNSSAGFFDKHKFNTAMRLMADAYIKKYLVYTENHRPNLLLHWFKYRTKIKLTTTESTRILANSTLFWLLKEAKKPQNLASKIRAYVRNHKQILTDNVKTRLLNTFNIYLNPKTCKQKVNFQSIPIIINNFNQLVYVRKLIKDLNLRGYNNIYIIDNNSSYQPLLEFYKTTNVKVIKLDDNHGHMALWKHKTIFKQFSTGYYVLTDPDILINEECPADFIKNFISILEKNKKITKVGFALQIDDIPDYYPLKKTVLNWEDQFWRTEIDKNQFVAPIDTTFALYRPYANLEKNFCNAIRVAGEYTSKHMGWYYNPNDSGAEETYYVKTASDFTTTWVVNASNEPRKNVQKYL